jgi:hypothetical protein
MQSVLRYNILAIERNDITWLILSARTELLIICQSMIKVQSWNSLPMMLKFGGVGKMLRVASSCSKVRRTDGKCSINE